MENKQRFTDWSGINLLFIGLLFNIIAAHREAFQGRKPMWIISVLEQAALWLRSRMGEDSDEQLDVMRQNLAYHDPYYQEASMRLADATQMVFRRIPEGEEGEPVTMTFPDGFKMDGMMCVPSQAQEGDGEGGGQCAS